jgi:hypothetical protein
MTGESPWNRGSPPSSGDGHMYGLSEYDDRESRLELLASEGVEREGDIGCDEGRAVVWRERR